MVVILVLGTFLHNRTRLRLIEAFVCGLLFFGMLCSEAMAQADCPTPNYAAQQKANPTVSLAR